MSYSYGILDFLFNETKNDKNIALGRQDLGTFWAWVCFVICTELLHLFLYCSMSIAAFMYCQGAFQPSYICIKF